jgi:hypothetical protein
VDKTFDKVETLQRLVAKLEEAVEDAQARSAAPSAPAPTPPTPAKRLSDQDIEERFRVPYTLPVALLP